MPRGASIYYRTARAWTVVNDHPGPGDPTGPVKWVAYAFSFWRPYSVSILDQVLEANLPMEYDRVVEKFAVEQERFSPTPVLRRGFVVNALLEAQGLGLFRWAILDEDDDEVARIDRDRVLTFGGEEVVWRRGA